MKKVLLAIIRDVTSRKAAAAPVDLNNFDWEAFDKKGFGEGYSKKEKEGHVEPVFRYSYNS